MQYNYRTTADINQLVGNLAEPSNLKGLESQLKLISDEIKEAEDNLALFGENIYVLRDDVADILFTTYGLCHRLAFTGAEATVPAVQNNGGSTNYAAIHIACANSDRDIVGTVDDLVAEVRKSFREVNEVIVTALPRAQVVAQVQRLLTATYLLGIFCDYPVDEDYAEVCRSNLSKFDETLEDAELTKAKYAALGVETTILEGQRAVEGSTALQTLYVTKSASDQVGTDNAKYRAGKWLKSHKWTESVYRDLSATDVERDTETESEDDVVGTESVH